VVDEAARSVKIPEKVLLEAVRRAPRQFTLYGADSGFSLEIGGDHIHFAALGTPTAILDTDTGKHRPTTLEDLVRHIKLINACQYIHCTQMDVWPNDIPMTTIHSEAIRAWVRNSRKPFGMGCYGFLPTLDMMRMTALAAGGKEELRRRPRFFSICSVFSPLQMSQVQLEGLLICAEYGQPLAMSPEAIAGATAPVTLAGLLVQENAAILAHIALAQIYRPGTPGAVRDSVHYCQIGYYAMVPELTGDYEERISINGYLMAYSIGGSLGAIILITVLGWYITDPALLFAAAGTGLGLLIIAPPLLVFRLTRGMLPDLPPEAVSFRSSMADTLSNRPFWWLIGLYSLSWTTAGVIAAALVYFATYYLRAPEQANYFVLIAQGSALFFVPLWVWISKRMDKGRTFVIGSFCWLVVLLAISGLGPEQIALAYLLAAISGAGIANAYVLPWSMIPDVVDYDQLRTGRRREGSYYAFASFFQKMAAGTALWAMGQALAAARYINPTAANPVPLQPEQAVQVIRLFMGPAPAALLILAIFFAWRYPLTREKLRQISDQLTAQETGRR